MTHKTRAPIRTLSIALLALAASWAGAWAAVQYLNDGALQNPSSGAWDLPAQGTCPADLTMTTRPDCLALRLPIVQASCTSPNYSWNTSGVCNDEVNTTQPTCEAQPDRLWNSGTSTCAIVMKGDDRNNVVCALHGGVWATTGFCIGNWVMPVGSTYNPPLVTGNGPGDQCLRCHNAMTQYNGPRVRDTENFLYTGHKNMARKVAVNKPWGGPPFSCTNPLYTDEQTCEENGAQWHPTIYPSDDAGNPINWITGMITVGGVDRELTWIYGDWLSPLPRAIYKAPAGANTCSIPLSGACSNPAYVTQGDCQANGGTWTANNTQTGCESNGGIWIANAGAAYTCARCHTTGWTSDATVNTAKEPEKSFPGITWARTAPAVFGQVNTAGGVTGDANQSSSWDNWGIVCTRCHSSAVDNSTIASCSGLDQPTCTGLGGTWSATALTCSGAPITIPACTGAGGTVVSSSPTGMSSHHSNLTSFDVASAAGICSDFRFTAQAQCDAAGGAWLTACSVAGVCSNLAYTTSGTCVGGGGVWTKYDTQVACTAASATWYTSTGCNVAGVCNTINPAHNTQALCEGAGGQWAAASDIVRCLGIHEYGKENNIPAFEAARWTGSKPNRGPIIVSLCMNCHRQETGGMPYANTANAAGTYDTVNPGLYLKVGPAHNDVSFVSHPHGNMFLNSPHGKFVGTFSQIGTGSFNYAGTGLYKSFFQTEGEANNVGNGCTGCHDVHESVVPETSPFPAIKEECTECHAKDLNKVQHPKMTGTPLENMATDPVEACEICHMPGGQHLFRVKADANYTTFPNSAMTATVNANTSPDGTFNEAVWVDMDHSCGQCHGAGTGQLDPTLPPVTGTIAAGSKVLAVADSSVFLPNQRIRIAGAGSLTYDDEGDVMNGDFDTYIVSVGPGVVNLAGSATKAVTDAVVKMNPTKNGAGYMTRAALAGWAAGMHNDKPTVTFSTSIGSPNTLTVNVDASAATCSGSAANCDAYDWNWGDGTPDGSGVTASHTYGLPGAYDITLTVEEYGVGGASATRRVNASAPDYAPDAVITACNFNADTWTLDVINGSTDDNNIRQVTVNWGDGTVIASDTTGPAFGPFSHTFLNRSSECGNIPPSDAAPISQAWCTGAGGNWSTRNTCLNVAPATCTGAGGSLLYVVTLKAIDSIGQADTATCAVSPAYFTISGTVQTPLGNDLAGAIVTVKKGAQTVGTGHSATNGTFTVGNLKPGTYTLTVARSGYTFAVPASTMTVGPNDSDTITALTGLGFAPKTPSADRKKQHGPKNPGGVVDVPAR